MTKTVWDAGNSTELMIARGMMNKMESIADAHAYSSMNLQRNGVPTEYIQNTPTGVFAHYDTKVPAPSRGYMSAMTFGGGRSTASSTARSSRRSTPASQIVEQARREVNGINTPAGSRLESGSSSMHPSEREFRSSFNSLSASTQRRFVTHRTRSRGAAP
eukprot:TRINITY_DN1812_c0_g1_i3.p1 TRINITY_DN1812_c0_g1~~TRINITY_DN1812_c0_g1_i3.p1  ORF type:complete len:160 (-),score=32.45 TRINITY_DN1812_c0_g1_i3:200-679(-)